MIMVDQYNHVNDTNVWLESFTGSPTMKARPKVYAYLRSSTPVYT